MHPHSAEELFMRWPLVSIRGRVRIEKSGASLQESHTPDWVKIVALLGWLFIVVGVAGEWITDALVSDADSNLQTFASINLAEAKKEAGYAIERAAVNELEAAKLRKGAAQLHKDAEKERLARVKIEASVAWRRLTEQQKRDIGVALTRPGFGFAQRGVSVWWDNGNTEAEMFAFDITDAVRAGTITVPPPNGIVDMKAPSLQPQPETGVIVMPAPDAVAQELAESIVRELNARGFDAIRDKSEMTEAGKKAIQFVWIHVAPRPEGPQGEYKLQTERDAKAKKQARRSK
jgi:hypothetical protein